MHLLSDSITDDDRHLYGELAINVLDMLTLYDRVLDSIGWFVTGWLRAHPPREEDAGVALETWTRGRDGDRAAAFVQVSALAEVPGNRTHFVNAFKRVKNARDHFAHASAMNAMTSDGVARIGIPHYARNPRVNGLDARRSSLDFAQVRKRIRDGHWMMQHVNFAIHWTRQRGGPFAQSPVQTSPPSANPPRTLVRRPTTD